ncbi:unnamed protein product, partial [Rotaria sp. Silwood1]
ALWCFNNLNIRLTRLLIERGFYNHVNLSSMPYHRFKKFLSLLQFNEIESLIIDCYSSPLQLRCWPYLPHLRILKVKGVRDVIDVFNFAQRHSTTLTHLGVESSEYFETRGLSRKLCYPSWNLCEFITKILNHLSALRSLDFGMESSFFLHHWPFKTIQVPLVYLAITLNITRTLLDIMSTEPLSHTLEQLHIKLLDESYLINSLGAIRLLPRMKALHTFSFVKSSNWHSIVEWTFVNLLTSSNIMPVLRRMNFSLVISVDDLIRMRNSALFTDFRHIDVHYAFIIDDDRPHIELLNYVPLGSQSHPRQMASATFISDCWPDNQPFRTPRQIYLTKSKNRQHLFYSLPWIFNEFFQLSVPDRCISELEVFISSSITKIHSSHLIKLNMSDNLASSTSFFSQIMSSNKIVELHLYRCNRQVSMNLPNVSHLILIDSLDSLNSTSLSLNIRSIQIILHYECLSFAAGDWTALHSLSTLPLLNSLRIILYSMRIPPDDTNCQIIAKITPKLLDFSFCFRRIYCQNSYDIDAAYKKHCLFIKQLRNCILNLSLNKQAYVFVEKDGCGLVICLTIIRCNPYERHILRDKTIEAIGYIKCSNRNLFLPDNHIEYITLLEWLYTSIKCNKKTNITKEKTYFEIKHKAKKAFKNNPLELIRVGSTGSSKLHWNEKDFQLYFEHPPRKLPLITTEQQGESFSTDVYSFKQRPILCRERHFLSEQPCSSNNQHQNFSYVCYYKIGVAEPPTIAEMEKEIKTLPNAIDLDENSIVDLYINKTIKKDSSWSLFLMISIFIIICVISGISIYFYYCQSEKDEQNDNIIRINSNTSIKSNIS